MIEALQESVRQNRKGDKVMKCDELQYERLGDANKTYPASTLVIRKQFVDAAIAELKAENRKLKRALWLARANTAESEARGWYHSNAYIIKYDGLHNIKGVLYGKGFKRYPEEWKKLWLKIERLCLAKAKEYE